MWQKRKNSRQNAFMQSEKLLFKQAIALLGYAVLVNNRLIDLATGKVLKSFVDDC
jgi:hypothetical protein